MGGSIASQNENAEAIAFVICCVIAWRSCMADPTPSVMGGLEGKNLSFLSGASPSMGVEEGARETATDGAWGRSHKRQTTTIVGGEAEEEGEEGEAFLLCLSADADGIPLPRGVGDVAREEKEGREEVVEEEEEGVVSSTSSSGIAW